MDSKYIKVKKQQQQQQVHIEKISPYSIFARFSLWHCMPSSA